MKTLVFDIPYDLSSLIEMLDYETGALRELLAYAASKGLENTTAYQKWEQDYHATYKEFQIAKQTLQNDYLPRVVEGTVLNWELTYSTNSIEVQVCQCEGEQNEEARVVL